MRSKMWIGVNLIAFALFVSGCKSDSMSMSNDSSQPKSLILKTHNGVSEIYSPGQGGTVMTYYEDKVNQCSQCDADAKAYYMTGHIDPVCKVCGATRTVIPYQSSSGHQ